MFGATKVDAEDGPRSAPSRSAPSRSAPPRSTPLLARAGGALAAAVVFGAGLLAATRAQREEATPRAAIGPSTIVMLGDSITEGGDWARLVPGREMANRGYAGSTTQELIAVADDVARSQPRAVVVLTGTNDIRDGHPPQWTAAQLDVLLDNFQRSAPDTVVVVQTILPRADAAARVPAANQRTVDLARARNQPVLDLYPVFDDGRGGLRPEDTTDGIHLSGAGYRRWSQQLLRYLDQAGL